MDLRKRYISLLQSPLIVPNPSHGLDSGLREKYSQVRLLTQLGVSEDLIYMISSAIIDHLRPVPDARESYLGYFFFDFKDTAKQDSCALLSSLLIQLSDQSDSCFDALFDIYSKHGRGSQQPSEGALLQCLKRMLIVLGQAPIYLIVDALDECPTTSKALGAPLSRQEVLEVLKELVGLRLPNLHICITSRPEVDIRKSVEQLACVRLSLHDQDGQREDIATYVRSVVYSDKYQATKWSGEVKERVVETLSRKADGMYVFLPKFITLAEIVTQVPLGGVPARSASGLPLAKCRASSERIARISRRDV
jgi:NACHT domain